MSSNKNFRYKVFEKAALARNFEEEVINNVKKKISKFQYMYQLVRNLYHLQLQLFVN